MSITNNDGLKIVHFDEYCKTCASKDVKQHEEPCCSCLDEPVRPNSHKPVKYEERY